MSLFFFSSGGGRGVDQNGVSVFSGDVAEGGGEGGGREKRAENGDGEALHLQSSALPSDFGGRRKEPFAAGDYIPAEEVWERFCRLLVMACDNNSSRTIKSRRKIIFK